MRTPSGCRRCIARATSAWLRRRPRETSSCARIAAAARAYQKYDDELAVAREKQLATEAKAEAARASTLITRGRSPRRRPGRCATGAALRGCRGRHAEAPAGRRRRSEVPRRIIELAPPAGRAAVEGAAGRRSRSPARAGSGETDARRRVDVLAAAVPRRRGRSRARRAARRSRRRTRLPRNLAVRRSGRLGGKDGGRTRHSWKPCRKSKRRARFCGRWREQLSVITNETAEAEKEEFSRFRSELQEIKVRSASS